MKMENKEVLEKANAAVAEGNNEGFLDFCTDDVVWVFVGDRTLRGKEAVRQYMAETYLKPPKFNVETIISEGDYVSVLGNITLNGADGIPVAYTYCDVWRFQDGKMAELKAFVI